MGLRLVKLSLTDCSKNLNLSSITNIDTGSFLPFFLSLDSWCWSTSWFPEVYIVLILMKKEMGIWLKIHLLLNSSLKAVTLSTTLKRKLRRETSTIHHEDCTKGIGSKVHSGLKFIVSVVAYKLYLKCCKRHSNYISRLLGYGFPGNSSRTFLVVFSFPDLATSRKSRVVTCANF